MLVQIITENGQKKVIPLTADAGAGNPVGTVIVVCSNQIPSNYLPLGTQYDTSLYPILYALLGTDTTPTASALGLPTLSSGQYAIKATSGLSENAQDNVINIMKEYTRNQNILADPETITISTNSNAPTIMQYDGFIVEQLATPNTNEYVNYSINGNNYVVIKSQNDGIATANMTVPYKKGDSVYIASVENHGANARVMQYKLRDYTGR